jgi:farnesyl diphosphate synthase/geranylgeranyl diphosphate synthase type II
MPTYPALVGLDAARERVRALHAEAKAALATHNWAASPLAALADWMLTRNR